MKAKKSYGQHFLTNESIAERIADSLSVDGSFQNILEVGPGKGMLTKYLLEKPFNFLAVEADKEMVGYLEKHYPSLRDQIVYHNFLRLNLDDLFDGQPFAIIGNFPYNISSQIVFKMLDAKARVPELVGMFQKEMALRIVAEPGGKEYGVISVLTQAYYEGEYLFSVKNSNFSPPPKVQSGVIRLKRKRVSLEDCDEQLFKKVVKIAFSQRRKMLRNTLKSIIPDNALLKEPFFAKRPEKISVADFIDITRRIKSELEVEQGNNS